MFFARVRCVGRLLDDAGIDNHSKTGRKLTAILVAFSKHCEAQHRRGEGALRELLDIGPWEWTLLAAMLAPVQPMIAERLASSLKLSAADCSALLARVRAVAAKLAEKNAGLTAELQRIGMPPWSKLEDAN